MLTENRSTELRDLYIKLNPLGLDGNKLQTDGDSFEHPATNKELIAFRAGYETAQQGQQHQGEPVARIDCEKLCLDFKPGWLQEQLNAGGHIKLYTHADPAEVERLREQVETLRLMTNDYLLETERLRGQLAELQQAFAESQEEVVKRGKMLAEQDALTAEAYRHDIGTPLKRDISAYRASLSASAEPSAPLPTVDGDLLPPIGSKVLIHLARENERVEHTVVGYYVWESHGLNQNVHRVFVRVRDAEGFLNARMLNEIRPFDEAATSK